MATLNPIVASPNPAPAGSASRVTVSYTTAPAQPDLTCNIQVLKDNVVQGQAVNVVLSGTPAEASPDTLVGATGVGYEIRTSAGVLRRVSQNVFDLTRS